jgi:3'-phosphoadenosine 5'-phosphosulfate (PAPS) 3'-phosphatase
VSAAILTDIDLQLVKGWLREAGKMALSLRGTLNIQYKPDNTLVTNVDLQIEDFLATRQFE